MSHAQFYACALFILVIYLVVRPIVQTLLSPLRSVPGPFFARFTRLWEFYAVHKYDFATYNIALHEIYGPIVRLGPNRYSINDAEAARVILGHHNALDKSAYYATFGSPSETNTFSELHLSTHAQMRRPITQLYSNTNLLSYEPFVDTCTNILVKRLGGYVRDEKTLDVRELMQYYAFDVIGEITVGSRFGLMEDDGDKSGIITAIDEMITYGAKVGLVPELHWLLGQVAKVMKLEPAFVRVMDFILLHVQRRTSGQTKSPEDREDFLDKMLPLEQQGKATRFDTINACGGNIGAGSDTTAISLSATIAYLSMHPNVLAKLRQELDNATNKGMLSDPATFKEAQKLPYLQAVIQESLRVHPAVGAPLTRVIGNNGVHLAGQYFPVGTEVGINAWVLHNNKDVFGPDASEFKPERWLTEDAEKRVIMDRNFLAFGAGPRTCIGKNISLLEMYKVIPQIVRQFDFEIVTDPKTSKGYTWKTLWFTKQDFKCLVKKRAA